MSLIILSIHMCYIHLKWVVVTSYFPDIEDHIKLEDDIIEDLVLGKQIKTHVHNLRPFIFSPNRVDPIELAQQNEQEFMVRDIIAHRGDHHRRSSMEFLVRWTGYDASSDSWQHLHALDLYNRRRHTAPSHQLSTLIYAYLTALLMYILTYNYISIVMHENMSVLHQSHFLMSYKYLMY